MVSGSHQAKYLSQDLATSGRFFEGKKYVTLFDGFTNPIYVFFGLANGVCLDDAGRQSSRIRRVTRLYLL